MKRIIWISILFLILIAIFFLLYFNYQKQYLTGATILNEYSYTKAICNETNYCQDYEIICRDKEVINKKPITGATIQNSLDWKDPRDYKTIERLCGE